MTYALQKGMCDSNSPAKLSIQKTFSHPLQFQPDVRCTSLAKTPTSLYAIRCFSSNCNPIGAKDPRYAHFYSFLRYMRVVQQAIQLQQIRDLYSLWLSDGRSFFPSSPIR